MKPQAWAGAYVVPMDAYRRLMLSRDWCTSCAAALFAAGFVLGEIVAALAFWLGTR